MNIALFALMMFGFALVIRGTYLVYTVYLGLKSLELIKELNINKVKDFQRYLIEALILLFLIMSVILVMFLFAHEGIS